MPAGQKNLKSEDDEGPEQDIAISGPTSKKRNSGAGTAAKRRCVSTACIACRRRKSKCDGNTPSCAACSSVYGTECVYDPNSDHRRKGVYKKDIDNLKTRNSTLQTLIQAILNYPEDRVSKLVQDIRSCDSLDDVAANIIAHENDEDNDESDNEIYSSLLATSSDVDSPSLENDVSGKFGSLRLDHDGQVRFIGATSSLNLLPSSVVSGAIQNNVAEMQSFEGDPMTSWTNVTKERELVVHLINMYFTWHYPYFTTLSKSLFFRDFLMGNPGQAVQLQKKTYCTPLLVNAMLALGCHFTAVPGSRTIASDSSTAGDHFFNEAKRLIMENDEHENPRLTTVQALALMSVREAGCGREARGWVYSGMSFRMAGDLGINLNPDGMAGMSDEEIDARKVTFWGCFLFDKCWSNYMGRMPQLTVAANTVPKYDVFPMEDAELWTPYTDSGLSPELSQAGRTRAVSLQIAALCEISNDILIGFYQPIQSGVTKEPKSARSEKGLEMKKLVELHGRLEEWLTKLPAEMIAKEGALMSVLIMHMFCQLLYLLLFRPFLKLSPGSAAFPAHLSPRRICTTAATTISKVLRLYKRTYGLKQICNVVVYFALSACTIHLINLPTKAAKRDIIQGVKSLEEISGYWLCGRRALIIVQVLSRRYKIELPEEAEIVLSRIDPKREMFGFTLEGVITTPKSKSAPATHPVVSNSGGLGSPLNGFSQASASHGSFHDYNDPFVFQPAQHRPMKLESSPSQPSGLYSPQFDHRLSPTSSTFGRHSIDPSTGSSPIPHNIGFNSSSANSPSMVNGYGHLENQSQNWWLRDQAELATDFGNWQVVAGLPSDSGSQEGDYVSNRNGHDAYGNGFSNGYTDTDPNLW